MKTPAEVHQLSSRELPESPPPHAYGDAFEHRSVRGDGSIKWAGGKVFVGEAFAGEVLGLTAVDEGRWHVHLGPLRLGLLHERSRTVVPLESGVTHVPGQGSV